MVGLIISSNENEYMQSCTCVVGCCLSIVLFANKKAPIIIIVVHNRVCHIYIPFSHFTSKGIEGV